VFLTLFMFYEVINIVMVASMPIAQMVNTAFITFLSEKFVWSCDLNMST